VTKRSVYQISAILILVGSYILLSQFFDLSPKIPTAKVETNQAQSKPTKIKIPSIGVDASVGELGLNTDQTIEVPKNVWEVGWYKYSPSPGYTGPSVMVGHKDAITGKAVFYDLKNIKVGDSITIEHEDGTTAVFKVDSMETYSQDNFPTDKVYGALSYPGLRLITCTGTYSRFKGRYSDNLVVYATLQ
jgi:LPXTG-site transpeptidase (sortase) family protein